MSGEYKWILHELGATTSKLAFCISILVLLCAFRELIVKYTPRVYVWILNTHTSIVENFAKKNQHARKVRIEAIEENRGIWKRVIFKPHRWISAKYKRVLGFVYFLSLFTLLNIVWFLFLLIWCECICVYDSKFFFILVLHSMCADLFLIYSTKSCHMTVGPLFIQAAQAFQNFP